MPLLQRSKEVHTSPVSTDAYPRSFERGPEGFGSLPDCPRQRFHGTTQLSTTDSQTNLLSKVPRVTLWFWAIKILATTVGDALSMTLDLGYAVSTLIFLAFFFVTLTAQVSSRRYHPWLYWAVVVATTTVGTTMSDYPDRTVGLGYMKSSALLLCGVIAC